MASIASDALTLHGPVTVTYGAHVFAVGSGPERVIVVTLRPVPLRVGTAVEATGRVRTFRREELEPLLGGAAFVGSQADQLEGAKCIVATSVKVR